MKFSVSLAAILLSFAVQVWAGDIRPVFEALKNEPVNYEPTGQICEQVARLQLYEDYPESRYHINVGVEYRVQKRTIGELDIVIIDLNSHDVVLVGEVKCWKSFGGALSKARDQRSRFIRTLKDRGPNIEFDPQEGGEFRAEQFKNTKYIAIAQNGATRHGFDMDLDFTLAELMELRHMLMRCQSQGQCPRP